MAATTASLGRPGMQRAFVTRNRNQGQEVQLTPAPTTIAT